MARPPLRSAPSYIRPMISSISSTSSLPIPTSSSTTDIAPHSPVHGGHHGHGASKMAAEIISSADTDDDGSISKSELTAMLAKNSGSTDSTAVSAKVDEIFKQIDTDGDGEISKSELTSALKTAHDQMRSAPTSDQSTTGTDNSTADGLASLLSSLMPPPPDAGYNATGVTTGTTNASTFSAMA